MENKVKFSENVFLIDTAYLNVLSATIQKMMGEAVGRTLPNLDLPAWLTYLALDAGIQEGANEIQVILMRDEATHTLPCCEPSDLDALQTMACRTSVGEFSFSCATTARLVSGEELFLDLTTLALDAADVKHLLLFPSQPDYGEKLRETLNNLLKDKTEDERQKVICFSLEKPQSPLCYRWDSPAFSVARAFGLRAEEL
ncbi:MAG: L-selectin [Bacteroides sp.]|nr:L-selectin [Bacteroides sp.]